jgi:hypothetical protein
MESANGGATGKAMMGDGMVAVVVDVVDVVEGWVWVDVLVALLLVLVLARDPRRESEEYVDVVIRLDTWRLRDKGGEMGDVCFLKEGEFGEVC